MLLHSNLGLQVVLSSKKLRPDGRSFIIAKAVVYRSKFPLYESAYDGATVSPLAEAHDCIWVQA